MEKSNSRPPENGDLIKKLIDNNLCKSRAEARRWVYTLPEEKIRIKLDKLKNVERP